VSAADKPSSRLRCRVTAAAESIVRRGHPWVFADSVRELNRPGCAGELAVIYDRQDKFLAIGLFDPDSPIRVRVLHAGRPANIDEHWWRARLDQALVKRKGILDGNTNACRLIHGESDGWPGLVLDRYDNVLVLKLYTVAWRPHMTLLLSLLTNALSPQRLVLRLSRNVQAMFATDGYSDGQTVIGSTPTEPVVFLESGLRFQADVVSGQKTGFFLDQRENRRAVETLAAGRTVLNAFSFSGGFSLYAARGGARSVTDLDISAHALASARQNFELNQSEPAIARCRHETIQANAFDWLQENHDRTFDVIILDPPSLAKREAERAGAIRAYEALATNAANHLAREGILVAASCSAHVSSDEFFGAVQQALTRAGRKFEVLKTSHHAADHPATFPEAAYLKSIFLTLR
jgi:23S rRNA (cytosine1962-C5)-methyltransferase